MLGDEDRMVRGWGQVGGRRKKSGKKGRAPDKEGNQTLAQGEVNEKRVIKKAGTRRSQKDSPRNPPRSPDMSVRAVTARQSQPGVKNTIFREKPL